MFNDPFHPAFYPNHPPRYKPPFGLTNNGTKGDSVNRFDNGFLFNSPNPRPIASTDDPPSLSSLTVLTNLLVWLIYLASFGLFVTLILIVPAYLEESQSIQDGQMMIPTVYQAEENMKRSEIDYNGIYLTGAIRSRIVLAIVSISMGISCLLLAIGTYYRSYCLTFIPSVLLIAPLIALTLDIYWAYSKWFKVLALVINSINCSLAYIYSCCIKQREYKSLTPLND